MGDTTLDLLGRQFPQPNLPLASLAKGWRPRFTISTALRLVAGIALYLTLIVSHGLITGIPVASF